ncbi:O-antigen ligase family protein [Rhodopirellula sallentina]|nr:O-antigen ligase family protein [Rhodopirellula sallentina]
MVATAICAPAILLALRNSNWLVDYLFFVVALNRGVRRMVDYQNGYFDKYSLISLTPIIVCGLATLVVLLHLNTRRRLGQATSETLWIYGLAVLGAFFIGLVNVRLGAVYALGEYIAPIGLLGYAAMHAKEPSVLSRWSNSVAFSTAVVAAYGIYQYYTIPPWDAFWVRAVGFEGYLGNLKPTEMTLFSTMAERGPAASYLCGGLILLLLRPKTLGVFRWPTIALVATAMLLTYSRTVVIWTALAVIVFPLINRGTAILPIAILALLVAAIGPSILSRLPSAEKITSRVSTIGAIQNDGSFKIRLFLIKTTLKSSLQEPFGLGIGSHGLAQRVGKANRGGSGDSTGYIQTLRTFGWIGFFMIVILLYKLWKRSSDLVQSEMDDANVRLFRAWFISGMVALFSGDWMFTATFFWVLAGHCLGLYDLALEEEMADDEAESDLEHDEFDLSQFGSPIPPQQYANSLS